MNTYQVGIAAYLAIGGVVMYFVHKEQGEVYLKKCSPDHMKFPIERKLISLENFDESKLSPEEKANFNKLKDNVKSAIEDNKDKLKYYKKTLSVFNFGVYLLGWPLIIAKSISEITPSFNPYTAFSRILIHLDKDELNLKKLRNLLQPVGAWPEDLEEEFQLAQKS